MEKDIFENPAPIASQVAERFRREIAAGVHRAGRPLPTYEVIARSYGVSKSTIFEAFGLLAEEGFVFRKQGKGTFINPDKVEPDTGRPLKNIALIAFDIFSAPDSQMLPTLEALAAGAARQRINLQFHFIRGMSVRQPGNEALCTLVANRSYQGLIICSPLDLADLNWFADLRIPFVLATSRYDLPLPRVMMDHRLAARLAGEIFMRREVRRIAAFLGPIAWQREHIVPYSRDIQEGFRDFSRESSLKVDFVFCDYQYEDARDKALKEYRPDHQGFFFQADVIAKGALSAFQRLGVDPAGRVLVNFCDREEYLVPINIKKPLTELGREALKLLKRAHAGRAACDRVVLLKPYVLETGG